jgi:hypothetical protein
VRRRWRTHGRRLQQRQRAVRRYWRFFRCRMLQQVHLLPFLLRPISKRHHPPTYIVETLMLIPTVRVSKVTSGSIPHYTMRVSVGSFSVGSCTCISSLVYALIPLQIGLCLCSSLAGCPSKIFPRLFFPSSNVVLSVHALNTVRRTRWELSR